MNQSIYHHIVALIAVILLVPAAIEAQTGGTSVTLKGAVTEIVTLSLLPSSTHNNIHMDVFSSRNTVEMRLSGSDAESRVIRVPLIVRSNTSFKISAVVESNTALLTQLSVIDVRATGTLVLPAAVSELHIPQQFDRRGADEKAATTNSSLPLDVARPLLVLTGPRISLGGALNSPDNALQITLLICMKTESSPSWSIDLTFTASPIQIPK